ncbi:MAG: PilZ domain-containing protein [Gammaproteobacteria bacterium]|nr:PilZ domain-containing protein [Gammaproteobacteria bacterium]
MSEKRSHERVDTVSKVKISHTTFGSRPARTRNISAQGLYIELSDQPHLPVGAHIQLNMLDSVRPDVAFNVKVLRTDKQGVALKFVDYEVAGERFELSELNVHWKNEAM